VNKTSIRLSQLRRLFQGRPLVHCWEDGPVKWYESDSGVGSTCMRLSGHFGAHDFIPDSEIGVVFKEGAGTSW